MLMTVVYLGLYKPAYMQQTSENELTTGLYTAEPPMQAPPTDKQTDN